MYFMAVYVDTHKHMYMKTKEELLVTTTGLHFAAGHVAEAGVCKEELPLPILRCPVPLSKHLNWPWSYAQRVWPSSGTA